MAKEYHISAKRLRIAGIEILNPQKTKEELTSQASCARKTKLKAYKGGKYVDIINLLELYNFII